MIEGTVLPFKLQRTDACLTAHAGLLVAHEFHLALGVDRLLDAHVPLPGSGRGHRPSEMVLPLVLMLLGGGEHLDDLRVIASDRALREAAGLTRVPASSTVGDWLVRTGSSGRAMGGLRKVSRALSRTMLSRDERTSYTLDVDATIIEAHKHDATRAYEGTVGYHPMLGFLFENRWLLHEQFRPGHASPGADAVKFIKACRRAMPKGRRIGRLRSDSAFYNHAVTDYCQDNEIEYVIAADWDAAVKDAYRTLPRDAWRKAVLGPSRRRSDVAETVHTFNKGKTSFRLIFVRDVEEQGRLFDDEPRGAAIITNIPFDTMGTAAVVEFYHQRGTMENYIKDLKHGVGMRRMPSGRIEANAAWFRIGALAYNLFLLSQALALAVDLSHVFVGTVRWRLYHTPARLVRHARRLIVNVAVDAATFAVLERWRRKAAAFAFS